MDPDRIGITAVSLGGYYAPRCAAFEKRFKACAVWGAIWDYHATWKHRIEQNFRTALSVPGDFITWVLGVEDLDAALAKLEKFTLAGVAEKITCPFFLTHGADDAQIPLEDARKLFDAVGAGDKTLKNFHPGGGGRPTLPDRQPDDWHPRHRRLAGRKAGDAKVRVPEGVGDISPRASAGQR